MNVSMYTLILIQSISIDFIKTIHWFVKRFIVLSNDCIYSADKSFDKPIETDCRIKKYIYISTQYFINLNPLTYIKIITQRINQGVGSDTTCYHPIKKNTLISYILE